MAATMSAHVLQQQQMLKPARQVALRPCQVQLRCVNQPVHQRRAVVMAAAATEASPVSSNGKVIELQMLGNPCFSDKQLVLIAHVLNCSHLSRKNWSYRSLLLSVLWTGEYCCCYCCL